MSLRWYLGYDLTGPRPAHSRLTRIRQRYGLPIFRRFFERFFEAIPVGGGGVRRPRRGRRGPPRLDRRGRASRSHADQRGGPAGRIGGAYRRTADLRARTTGPAAPPLRRRCARPGAARTSGITHLGYHDHDVVDGGKARIGLTTLVTPAEGQDNQPALALLWRTRCRWRLRPRQMAADANYATAEHIPVVEQAGVPAIEQAGVPAYVPLSGVGRRAGLCRDPGFD